MSAEASRSSDETAAGRCIGVTVRTPAGASTAFGVDPAGTTTAVLVERSVAWFVERGLLEPGGFRLGLLRGSTIVDLAEEDTLATGGVEEGDVLHLLTTEPQVDGAGWPAGPDAPAGIGVGARVWPGGPRAGRAAAGVGGPGGAPA